jgi:hypothetical protein
MPFGILIAVDDAVVRWCSSVHVPPAAAEEAQVVEPDSEPVDWAPNYTPRRLTQVCEGRPPAALARLGRQLGPREPVPPA